MQAKIDSKVFKEMITTEASYNESLAKLLLALSTGSYIQENPLLLKFKHSITVLKGLSDDLLLNAEVSFEEHTSEKGHLLLRNQRISLLTAFFNEYKNYISLYDNYMEQLEQHPKQFDKINAYFSLYKIQPGFEAHLIQPVQRGPRYQLLIIAAKENNTGVTERNVQELKNLEQLVKDFLFSANNDAAKASPYWFGKITYTLLWGKPDQLTQGQAPQAVVAQEVQPNSETHAGYRPGDLVIIPLAQKIVSFFSPAASAEPAAEEGQPSASKNNSLGNG